MKILAIDSGPKESGWTIYEAGGSVIDSGVADNHDVLRWVQASDADHLALEMIAGMGMTVGQSTFDTCKWIGRFIQAWREPDAAVLIFRREVKSHLCGSQQAKDKNIRQALIDKVGEPGTKKAPGPTYGVSSHAWSALAVAVTAAETKLKSLDQPAF